MPENPFPAAFRSLPRSVRFAPPLAAVGLVVAGCGSSSAPKTTPAAAVGGVTLATRSGGAGTYLTDGSGGSLYLFKADQGTTSGCVGACASAWPPLTATGHAAAAGSGVQAADIGSITRPDGSRQVTYNGHPLYRFAGDSGPGKTAGQGSTAFGGKWWLVTPKGDAITTSAGGSPAGGGGVYRY